MQHPGVDRDLVQMMATISLRALHRLGEVSPTQLRALAALGASGRLPLAILAGCLGVTAAVANRLVDRLVAAGLMQRGSTLGHGPVQLRLTARGRATLGRYDRYRLEEAQALLPALPEQRRQDLLAATHEFGAAGQAGPPGELAPG